MKQRALQGVEVFKENSYGRTFRTEQSTGFFTVTDHPEQSALELKIGCDDIKYYEHVYNRVRKVFDLDTDFRTINEKFSKDKLLARGMRNGHVPRLPVAFDPFEFVVRAILGQQISVKAATTIAARVIQKAGIKTDPGFPEGLDHFFPNPSDLLILDLDGLGLSNARQQTLKSVAYAVLHKKLKLTTNQSFGTFHKDFSSIKGIGDWTVNYVAMRGMGMADSFPAGDLGIVRALAKNSRKPSYKEIQSIAEAWRPYRAYAAMCIWNSQ